MVSRVFSILFGCRHKRITRPMTPARKPGAQMGSTYVVCLDCGQQFHYDVANMRMGAQVAVTQASKGSSSFQAQR
jgi:hypothetical protein